MKTQIINFLRAAFPFLAVLVLWRLSYPFWNPAGVLAIIPIFYCSFVRPTPWFAPWAVLFCFLLDYKFDTLFYWTALYCILYAANGFQNFIDLTRAPKNAIAVFMIFFGCAILILALMNFNLTNIVRALWIFAWTCTLYMPITILIKRASND